MKDGEGISAPEPAPAMHQHTALPIKSPVGIAAIFVSGIGGSFQLGYGISVMTSPSEFLKELLNRTSVHRYHVSLEQWQISLIWSFAISIFSIGGLLGALLSSPLLAKFGRKRCLLLNNFVAISGAVLMMLSRTTISFEMIIVGRFLYGVNAGLGISIPAHTLYISECAPRRMKGMVGVTTATYVSFGILCGQLLGISELLGTEENWPWLLGFSGFAAFFQLITLPFLPESPSFLLIDRGDRQACEKAFKTMWGDEDYSREVEEMLQEKEALQGVHKHSVLELIQSRAVRRQLLTTIITYIALQLCGINAVYFYSFEVFRAAGIPEIKLPYAALGMGLCEVSTSLICIVSVERVGRKMLLYVGYIVMSAILSLLTVTLYLQNYASWIPYSSMVLMFILIFSYSCGCGGITPSLPAYIFTQSYKPAAYTLGTFISWLGMFVLGMLFPVLLEKLGYCCLVVFLLSCVGSALFVKFYVPEMKNRTVLEITAAFEKMQSKSREDQRSTEQPENVVECEMKV